MKRLAICGEGGGGGSRKGGGEDGREGRLEIPRGKGKRAEGPVSASPAGARPRACALNTHRPPWWGKPTAGRARCATRMAGEQRRGRAPGGGLPGGPGACRWGPGRGH